jgi:hypothetical protein
MNFTSAIQAHTNWKLRLAALCHGKQTEGVDPAALAKDNLCELGQWLHGPGRKYVSDADYGELLKTHAGFHRAASAIASMGLGGKAEEACASLQSKESDFSKLSLRVCKFLMDFRTRYGDA